MSALVALAALAGCVVDHRVTIMPRDIHRELATLRASGRAEVAATVTHGDREASRQWTLRFDQQVTINNKRRTLAELATKCKDVVPFAEDTVSQADCELVKLSNSPIEVAHYQTRSVGKGVHDALVGTLVFGTLGGLIGGGICTGLCKDGSRAKEIGEVALGVSSAVVVGALILAIVSCKGRWGQPGCRD